MPVTRTRAIVRAISLGLLVGVVVTFATNEIIYGQPSGNSASPYLGFWGLVFGSFAMTLSVLGVLALSLDARRKGMSLNAMAGVLGILGTGAACWIFAWRVPPFTLEGAWLYPMAIVLLVSAVLVKRRGRELLRGSRGVEHPSSPGSRKDRRPSSW
jgi:peptidoglycan/LPS O-acetylase OafA/YrhL